MFYHKGKVWKPILEIHLIHVIKMFQQHTFSSYTKIGSVLNVDAKKEQFIAYVKTKNIFIMKTNVTNSCVSRCFEFLSSGMIAKV